MMVDEIVNERTVWVGDVEVFALTGHPNAQRCYAWISRLKKNDTTEERIFAVLEIPPVDSSQEAVRVSVVSGSRNGF